MFLKLEPSVRLAIPIPHLFFPCLSTKQSQESLTVATAQVSRSQRASSTYLVVKHFTRRRRRRKMDVSCVLLMCASPISPPPFAWLFTICMQVSVGEQARLYTNDSLSLLFCCLSSGAPRGMTLFPLLPLRILSPLRKTVGRNKGTANPLFSLLYSYLCCKSCVCVCVCVCVCARVGAGAATG